MVASEGSLGTDGKFEYFVYASEVWRAPLDCPIRWDIPVRGGARWFSQSPNHSGCVDLMPMCDVDR